MFFGPGSTVQSDPTAIFLFWWWTCTFGAHFHSFWWQPILTPLLATYHKLTSDSHDLSWTPHLFTPTSELLQHLELCTYSLYQSVTASLSFWLALWALWRQRHTLSCSTLDLCVLLGECEGYVTQMAIKGHYRQKGPISLTQYSTALCCNFHPLWNGLLQNSTGKKSSSKPKLSSVAATLSNFRE